METKTNTELWKLTEAKSQHYGHIGYAINENNSLVGEIRFDDDIPKEKTKANAELIVTAVNACKTINPDNPLNAAKVLSDLVNELNILLPTLRQWGWHEKLQSILEQATE